jgi:flagellar hook-associated protein 3 FlgL
MPISTKLFNEQAVARFNSLTADIQNTQGRIATGKNILRASDDPVAAANISFTRDQKVILDRFNTNIDRAQARLSLTENVLAESVNLITRA